MEILNGFEYLFSNPTAVMFVFAGALVGMVVGAIPGLSASAAIAMIVPATFYLDPLSALGFLYVIGKSGRYGGSISAILFNTPGTAAAAATMQDGYPMTQKGQSGKALKIATVASVFGDFVGEFILIFGVAYIAAWTLSFGPPEYFAVYFAAFVIIGSVIGKSIIKGIISTLLGAVLSLIGMDPITGESRYTFNIYELENGLSLVPLLIGLFVFSEILVQFNNVMTNKIKEVAIKSNLQTDNTLTFLEIKKCFMIMLRSSAIGAFIGIMPGLGSAVACFVAYGEEKRRSKNKKLWGTGIVEGVAAPESANNAVSGPTMIPLLTLGIPGSTIAAILIGVFLIHGIQVGPTIFATSKDLVYALFACGLLGIVSYGILGYFFGPLLGRTIAVLSPNIIYPFVLITGFIAAYSARQSLFDVGLAILFGVIGYLLRLTGYSLPALLIAFVLARNAEEAFRQSLLLSEEGIGIFLDRPIAIMFFLLGLIVLMIRIKTKDKSSEV
ncbi:tripartite tricarboxylate transporter permease [Alphaproteobacteria bacterium]|nr:tripartite tricarboxylate transporter permease [Alphaproteobacteria bacterium]